MHWLTDMRSKGGRRMKCNYNGCSSKCKGDIDVESCNVLRAYQQGAKEFAEWLNRRKYFDGWYKFDGNEEVKLTTDEILAEWIKSKQ